MTFAQWLCFQSSITGAYTALPIDRFRAVLDGLLGARASIGDRSTGEDSTIKVVMWHVCSK